MSGPAFHWEGRTCGPYLRKREGAILLPTRKKCRVLLLTDAVNRLQGWYPIVILCGRGLAAHFPPVGMKTDPNFQV